MESCGSVVFRLVKVRVQAVVGGRQLSRGVWVIWCCFCNKWLIVQRNDA